MIVLRLMVLLCLHFGQALLSYAAIMQACRTSHREIAGVGQRDKSGTFVF